MSGGWSHAKQESPPRTLLWDSTHLGEIWKPRSLSPLHVLNHLESSKEGQGTLLLPTSIVFSAMLAPTGICRINRKNTWGREALR